MRSRFDDDGNPDLKVVVAEYRDAMKKRARWVGPVFGGILLVLFAWLGTFTVNPGERGVVQTFGAYSALKKPGLHFIVPIVQKYTIVNIEKVRREEIGFRTTQNGPKIVPPAINPTRPGMRRRSAMMGPSATTAKTIVMVSSTLPFSMRARTYPR